MKDPHFICDNLNVPLDKIEQASRFLSDYKQTSKRDSILDRGEQINSLTGAVQCLASAHNLIIEVIKDHKNTILNETGEYRVSQGGGPMWKDSFPMASLDHSKIGGVPGLGDRPLFNLNASTVSKGPVPGNTHLHVWEIESALVIDIKNHDAVLQALKEAALEDTRSVDNEALYIIIEYLKKRFPDN